MLQDHNRVIGIMIDGSWETGCGKDIPRSAAEHFDNAEPPKLSKSEIKLINMTRLLDTPSAVLSFAA